MINSPSGERSSTCTSGRDDSSGSNFTKARRAAWKNKTIISAAARNARSPFSKATPAAPIRNARAASNSGIEDTRTTAP